MTWLVEASLFLLAAATGMAATWAVARWHFRRQPPPDDASQDDAQNRIARDTLTRLQDVTRRVQADVIEHNSCVGEINAQLLTCDDADEKAVLEAVAQLVDANSRMQRQLDTAEERLQAQARQIESQSTEARTDSLTQVANRRALDDELKRCAADHEQNGTPTTVMLVDIDHFKRLNDTHGHQAGDDVLRGVARVLRTALSDTGLVARYGGEEFALVFAGMPASAVKARAEQIRLAIAGTTFRVNGRPVTITASGGVAEFMPGETDKELVRRADEALYASKRGGRNRAHFNDGRSNHIIQSAAAKAVGPAPLGANQVGDEWLYEPEPAAVSPFQEAIPQISNRPAFFDALIGRLAEGRRGGAPVTLLMVQVDSLSRIVSDHSPSAGDVVLRVVAQLTTAVMRDMDLVARLGDDTFILMLPGAMLGDGIRIAERLRSAVERCRLPRKAGASWCTISAGVVEANEADDLRRVLQRGRGALTAAIIQGRNRVVGHDALGATLRESELAAR